MDEFDYKTHGLQVWLQQFAPKGYHSRKMSGDAFYSTVVKVQAEYMPRIEKAFRTDAENGDMQAIMTWGHRLDEVDTWATDMEDLLETMRP